MTFYPNELASIRNKDLLVMVKELDSTGGALVESPSGRRFLIRTYFLEKTRVDMDRKVPWHKVGWMPKEMQ